MNDHQSSPTPPPTLPTVAVFCGSNYGRDKELYSGMAQGVGKILAEAGYHLVTGGGPGLMGEVNQAAHEAGGVVTSIQYGKNSDHQCPYYTRCESYETLAERQWRLIELADAFVALPGGVGTVFEVIEICTRKNTGEMAIDTPMILLDAAYYSFLPAFFTAANGKGFLNPTPDELITVVDTVDAVLATLDEAASVPPRQSVQHD